MGVQELKETKTSHGLYQSWMGTQKTLLEELIIVSYVRREKSARKWEAQDAGDGTREKGYREYSRLYSYFFI